MSCVELLASRATESFGGNAESLFIFLSIPVESEPIAEVGRANDAIVVFKADCVLVLMPMSEPVAVSLVPEKLSRALTSKP